MMKKKYIIAVSVILTPERNRDAGGFPFVRDMYVFDQAMYAANDFYELSDAYNCEIKHISDDKYGVFGHAVGVHDGEIISITVHTVYRIEEPGFNGTYST